MYVQDPGNDVAYDDDAPLETPENPSTQFIRVCLLQIWPFLVLCHSGNFCVKTLNSSHNSYESASVAYLSFTCSFRFSFILIFPSR